MITDSDCLPADDDTPEADTHRTLKPQINMVAILRGEYAIAWHEVIRGHDVYRVTMKDNGVTAYTLSGPSVSGLHANESLTELIDYLYK